MYERILRKMQERIRSRHYVMTTHADEEMWEDGLAIQDIENTILRGQIVGRQKDLYGDEWKYLVSGHPLDSNPVVAVAKIGHTGELIIITVYLDAE